MFTYKALSGCLLLHGMQAVSLQFVTYEVSRYVSDKRLMDVIYDLLESFTDFWYFEGFWECTDPYVMDLDYILLCFTTYRFHYCCWCRHSHKVGSRRLICDMLLIFSSRFIVVKSHRCGWIWYGCGRADIHYYDTLQVLFYVKALKSNMDTSVWWISSLAVSLTFFLDAANWVSYIAVMSSSA